MGDDDMTDMRDGYPVRSLPLRNSPPMAEVTHTYRFNDGHGEPIAECKLVRRLSGTLWIASLWVHPEYRKQGYGTRILDQVIAEWGDEVLYLIVNPYTDQPLDLYQLHDWYMQRWGFDLTDVPDVLKREEDE